MHRTGVLPASLTTSDRLGPTRFAIPVPSDPTPHFRGVLVPLRCLERTARNPRPLIATAPGWLADAAFPGLPAVHRRAHVHEVRSRAGGPVALELEPILRAVTICARWTGFLPTSTISCSAASGNMASSWTDRPSVLTSVTEGGVDERHLVLVPDCSRVLFRGALAASGWRVSGGGTAGKT